VISLIKMPKLRSKFINGDSKVGIVTKNMNNFTNINPNIMKIEM